jgi:RHS repeat-associated protein
MFTGRRFDFETGLYYYRARYYNPYIGRFLQTDPVGYDDGINWYLYCKNNPLTYVDPLGSWFVQEKPSSCAAATIMNVLLALGIGDITEEDIRNEIEIAMGVPNPNGNNIAVWGEWANPTSPSSQTQLGSGVPPDIVLSVLNSHLPEGKKYQMLTSWDMDTLAKYAAKSPVVYLLGGNYVKQKPGDTAEKRGPWHFVMLQGVEINTEKTIEYGTYKKTIRADWYWTVDPAGAIFCETKNALQSSLYFSLKYAPILVPNW